MRLRISRTANRLSFCLRNCKAAGPYGANAYNLFRNPEDGCFQDFFIGISGYGTVCLCIGRYTVFYFSGLIRYPARDLQALSLPLWFFPFPATGSCAFSEYGECGIIKHFRLSRFAFSLSPGTTGIGRSVVVACVRLFAVLRIVAGKVRR